MCGSTGTWSARGERSCGRGNRAGTLLVGVLSWAASVVVCGGYFQRKPDLDQQNAVLGNYEEVCLPRNSVEFPSNHNAKQEQDFLFSTMMLARYLIIHVNYSKKKNTVLLHCLSWCISSGDIHSNLLHCPWILNYCTYVDCLHLWLKCKWNLQHISKG